MKYLKKAFLVVIILSLTFSCKESVNSDKWIDYKSDDLSFTAKFPEKPKRTLNKVPSDVGELDLHVVMYTDNDGALAVMRTDYPEEMFENPTEEFYKIILDGAVNGAVTKINGELISDEKITLKGHKGRSIKVKAKIGYLYLRAYLVKNVIYVVQVVLPIKDEGKPRIETFFNSFDII